MEGAGLFDPVSVCCTVAPRSGEAYVHCPDGAVSRNRGVVLLVGEEFLASCCHRQAMECEHVDALGSYWRRVAAARSLNEIVSAADE